MSEAVSNTDSQNSDNDKYDSDSLWEKDFFKGSGVDKTLERVMDFDETVEEIQDEMGLEDYDEEHLWNIDREKLIVDYEEYAGENDEAVVNPNLEYDSDSLWNKNIKQGRNK